MKRRKINEEEEDKMRRINEEEEEEEDKMRRRRMLNPKIEIPKYHFNRKYPQLTTTFPVILLVKKYEENVHYG